MAEAYQGGIGVIVVYRDYMLARRGDVEKRHRSCPGCGYRASSEDRYASSPSAYSYRCRKCVDVETCKPMTWKEA